MALGDVRQVGTEFKIGFNNLVYTGYLPEDGVSYSDNTSTEEIVTDERGANLTHMYFNDGKVIDVSFKIKSTGSITPPKKGAIISITAPDGSEATNWLVQDADVTFNRSISMLKLSLLREDSMQSIYDADTAPAAPTVSLVDAGSGEVTASIASTWTTAANKPDAVDLYLAITDSQPTTPFATLGITLTATSGNQGYVVSSGTIFTPADTVYAWVIARNGTLSSTAGTDSQLLA